MNKETIEKAAMEYSGLTDDSKDPYARKKGSLCIAFSDGAHWRINSVWHPTNKLPENSGYLAVLMDNGLMETMYYSAGIGFHEMQLKGYTSWAYVDDLIPDRKENNE